MDPNDLHQVAQQGPMTFATVISAFAVGIGLAVKWWADRKKRDSADGVGIANDGASRAAAVSVESAIQIQASMIGDLRAQIADLTQRVQSAADSRNDAAGKVSSLERAVSDLQSQLTMAKGSNSRLSTRVQMLEDQLRAAGVAIPPDHGAVA